MLRGFRTNCRASKGVRTGVFVVPRCQSTLRLRQPIGFPWTRLYFPGQPCLDGSLNVPEDPTTMERSYPPWSQVVPATSEKCPYQEARCVPIQLQPTTLPFQFFPEKPWIYVLEIILSLSSDTFSASTPWNASGTSQGYSPDQDLTLTRRQPGRLCWTNTILLIPVYTTAPLLLPVPARMFQKIKSSSLKSGGTD